MTQAPAPPDFGPGDAVVTLTDLRHGDLVRLERLDAHTVGLRAVPPGGAAGPGPLFRVEMGARPGAMRLVQVLPGGVN